MNEESTLYTGIEPSLVPTPVDKREYGSLSYTLSWIGAVVNINSFMMGAALVPPSGVLNLPQAVLAMIVGMGLILILMTLNGEPGHKYGIPMVIQCRASFGMRGALVPGIIRALPCIFWYSIQTWIGAGAIKTVFGVVFGIGGSIMTYYIGFLLVQILLSCMGFKGIKWMENFGAAFIIVALFVMFLVIYSTFKSDIIENLIEYKGSWGYAWWIAMATFGSTYATYVVTMGDIIRELRSDIKRSATFVFHLIGVAPFTMFMAIIGLLCSGVTGTWDPISVFAEVLPNKPLLVVTLLFIAFAQITTNVLMNVVPAANVVVNYTPLKRVPASIVIGAVAAFCMPWKLTTSTGFTHFVTFISAFLIPTGIVMICDYWIVRGRRYSLEDFYDVNGPFSGINWNGIIAILVGAAFGLAFKLTWIVSIVPTAVAYVALCRGGWLSKPFLKDSRFAK